MSGISLGVVMADLIPGVRTRAFPCAFRRRGVARQFEDEYAENFSEKMGAIAKPFRMALGALIIKEKLGTSDRETVEQIR